MVADRGVSSRVSFHDQIVAGGYVGEDISTAGIGQGGHWVAVFVQHGCAVRVLQGKGDAFKRVFAYGVTGGVGFDRTANGGFAGFGLVEAAVNRQVAASAVTIFGGTGFLVSHQVEQGGAGAAIGLDGTVAVVVGGYFIHVTGVLRRQVAFRGFDVDAVVAFGQFGEAVQAVCPGDRWGNVVAVDIFRGVAVFVEQGNGRTFQTHFTFTLQAVFVGVDPEVVTDSDWFDGWDNAEVDGEVGTGVFGTDAVVAIYASGGGFEERLLVVQYHEVGTQASAGVVSAVVVAVEVGVSIQSVATGAGGVAFQDVACKEVVRNDADLVAACGEATEQVAACCVGCGGSHDCTRCVFQFQRDACGGGQFAYIRQAVVVGVDPDAVAEAVGRCFRLIEAAVYAQVAVGVGVAIVNRFATGGEGK